MLLLRLHSCSVLKVDHPPLAFPAGPGPMQSPQAPPTSPLTQQQFQTAPPPAMGHPPLGPHSSQMAPPQSPLAGPTMAGPQSMGGPPPMGGMGRPFPGPPPPGAGGFQQPGPGATGPPGHPQQLQGTDSTVTWSSTVAISKLYGCVGPFSWSQIKPIPGIKVCFQSRDMINLGPWIWKLTVELKLIVLNVARSVHK